MLCYRVKKPGPCWRSCDKHEMREMFYTISDGHYKDILYKEFSKERVDKELDEFLIGCLSTIWWRYWCNTNDSVWKIVIF